MVIWWGGGATLVMGLIVYVPPRLLLMVQLTHNMQNIKKPGPTEEGEVAVLPVVVFVG